MAKPTRILPNNRPKPARSPPGTGTPKPRRRPTGPHRHDSTTEDYVPKKPKRGKS